MKRFVLISILLCSASCFAQDSTYTRRMIAALTSKNFWGRGYTKNGMGRAADYLSAEFKALGLSSFIGDYKQYFSYPVNTFPAKMRVTLNGKKLIPGKDFIVSNESKGLKVNSNLEMIDSLHFKGVQNLQVVLKDKLTWSVATEVRDYTLIEVIRKFFTERPKDVNVEIENHFIENFETSNVCGYVKGTTYPDSIVMITAHYDHLGGMGAETYFPGANDNAAGVASLLSLAKYYAAHPQPYSVGFICFAGEEAGLVGSKYFTEHPLMALNKIKFLINLDLVGTGEKGMTVVNGSVYPKAFELLNKINAEHNYISKITVRGKAANSDHYFFTEKGVPAFFIYTQGGPSAYHDIFDRPETLPLTEYNDLFKLIVDFNKKLMVQ